jgi:hypothetical protein
MLCLRGAREFNSIVMVERDGRVYGVLTVYFSKTPRIVVLLADEAWLPYSARSWTGGDWDIRAVGGGKGIEEAERGLGWCCLKCLPCVVVWVLSL